MLVLSRHILRPTKVERKVRLVITPPPSKNSGPHRRATIKEASTEKAA